MDAIANLSGYQIREQLYAGLRTLVYPRERWATCRHQIAA
jgi:hypothetical protein